MKGSFAWSMLRQNPDHEVSNTLQSRSPRPIYSMMVCETSRKGSSRYPMAWHGVALDLPLMTVYLMKYGVPDYGDLKTFHT